MNRRPGRIRSFPAAIALLAGMVVLGCSAVGYGFGGILATKDRRDVAPTDLRDLKQGQYVWLTLDTGERVSGRLIAIDAPDSLVLRAPAGSSYRAPGDHPPASRCIPLASIATAEVPHDSHRIHGLRLGLATDLGLVFFIMTRDHKFYPSSP